MCENGIMLESMRIKVCVRKGGGLKDREGKSEGCQEQESALNAREQKSAGVCEDEQETEVICLLLIPPMPVCILMILCETVVLGCVLIHVLFTYFSCVC